MNRCYPNPDKYLPCPPPLHPPYCYGRPEIGRVYVKLNTGHLYQVIGFATENNSGKTVALCKCLRNDKIVTFRDNDFSDLVGFRGSYCPQLEPYENFLPECRKYPHPGDVPPLAPHFAREDEKGLFIYDTEYPNDIQMPGRAYLYKQY